MGRDVMSATATDSRTGLRASDAPNYDEWAVRPGNLARAMDVWEAFTYEHRDAMRDDVIYGAGEKFEDKWFERLQAFFAERWAAGKV